MKLLVLIAVLLIAAGCFVTAACRLSCAAKFEDTLKARARRADKWSRRNAVCIQLFQGTCRVMVAARVVGGVRMPHPRRHWPAESIEGGVPVMEGLTVKGVSQEVGKKQVVEQAALRICNNEHSAKPQPPHDSGNRV